MRLETERLILRPIDPERDFDGWARAMADERTVRYLGSKPMNRAEAWRSMAMALGHWSIRGYGFFSVERKEDGAWLGRVGPWFPEGWPEREVGWTLAPEHWGRGYASEAALASLAYARDVLGWRRVVHVIMDGNAASVAVAERIGSKLLSSQQGVPGVTQEKVLIYGQDL